MILANATASNPYVPLLFVLGLLTLSMTWARHRVRMKRREARQARAQVSNSSVDELPAAAQSLQKIMLDIEEAARRVNAQLDTKFVRLERTIAAADRRLVSLEELLERAQNSVPQSPTTSVDPNAAPTPPPDPRFAHIYQLADTGASTQQIADAVNMPIGEVEVVLNLRGTF